MKAMGFNLFDLKGTIGTVLTFILAGVGVFTLNQWATIMAICAGATTVGYNCVRIYKEIKNKKHK